jgi:hypothetical protein
MGLEKRGVLLEVSEGNGRRRRLGCGGEGERKRASKRDPGRKTERVREGVCVGFL